MAVRAFAIPEDTLRAMKELAGITDVDGKDPLTGLIVDALRTYEWIIAQQAQGKVIAALMPEELDVLAHSDKAPDAERESLAPFIRPERREKARKYFANA